MSRSRFVLPAHILVGADLSAGLNMLFRKQSSEKILLVTSAGWLERDLCGFLTSICPSLQIAGIITAPVNPSRSFIETQLEGLRKSKFSRVLGVGGGSVIDSAKLFRAGLSVKESRLQAIQGWNSQPRNSRVGLVVAPTTAGTGAEVTPFATVWNYSGGQKGSVERADLPPDHVILDPKLLLSLPQDQILYPALDAISHALESLWNRNRVGDSEIFAKHALALLLPHIGSMDRLKIDDLNELQIGSTYAGLAISITRTSIAHSISYSFTSNLGVPHGLAVSFLLPKLIDFWLPREVDPEISRLMLAAKKSLQTLSLKREVLQFGGKNVIRELLLNFMPSDRSLNFPLEITGNLLTQFWDEV